MSDSSATDQPTKGAGSTAGERLIVTEGISGVWHYHLSYADKFTRGLCGRQTMRTSIPLSTWGHRSAHIGESYCAACARRAGLTPAAPLTPPDQALNADETKEPSNG